MKVRSNSASHSPKSPAGAFSLAAGVFLMALAFAQPAEAARRLPLLNGADILYRVAPLPPEYGGDGLMLGYKCGQLSVLGANIFNSNCRLVAMPDETSYALLPSELVERLAQDPRFQFDQTQRSWWHRYGFWGPVTALGVFFALALIWALIAWVTEGIRGRRIAPSGDGELAAQNGPQTEPTTFSVNQTSSPAPGDPGH